MQEKYYSTIETAKILGVSRKTVFDWARKGKIKSEKIGRNYIVSHEGVMEKLGKSLGVEKKHEIERAIDKALKDYGKTFRLLGKEDET